MSGRRDKGGGGHGGGGEERWLLPYADMITLLLGLFIVLFAMSSIDAKQFDNVKRSLSDTFNGAILDGSGDVFDGSNGVLDPTSPSQAETDTVASIDDATRRTAERFQAETRKLDQMAKQLNLGNDVEVARTELGIQISIAGDALFASGEYQLSSPGIRTELARIAGELRTFGAPIRIEGHTDGAPFPNGLFDNEGLSAMRALSVQQYFAGRGFPRDEMHIAAYGPTVPKVQPRTPTSSEPRNRRIEIIVMEAGAEDGFDNEAVERTAKAQRERSSAPTAAAAARAEVTAAVDDEFGIVAELAATGKGVQ